MEIGNGCCLINETWTVKEIEGVWGIPKGELTQFEATAWKKIYRRNAMEETNKSIYS
jgi:hypothetical protein